VALKISFQKSGMTKADIYITFFKSQWPSFPKPALKMIEFSQTIEIGVLWINKSLFFACKNRIHVVSDEYKSSTEERAWGKGCGHKRDVPDSDGGRFGLLKSPKEISDGDGLGSTNMEINMVRVCSNPLVRVCEGCIEREVFIQMEKER